MSRTRGGVSRERVWCHGRSVDWQGWAACAAAVAGFALCLVGWLMGGGAVSLPWRSPRRCPATRSPAPTTAASEDSRTELRISW